MLANAASDGQVDNLHFRNLIVAPQPSDNAAYSVEVVRTPPICVLAVEFCACAADCQCRIKIYSISSAWYGRRDIPEAAQQTAAAHIIQFADGQVTISCETQYEASVTSYLEFCRSL